MRIHTVKEGDTIFKIARSYSVPPAKIIENNALTTPDRLYPGQKLVILTPTRTYTVRGGDTLSSIALRFGTELSELKRNNPSLMGGERIYPGQIIAVKYGEKEYGSAVVNGYFSKDTEIDRLSVFLPFLSFLTIASHIFENGELSHLFNYAEALRLAKSEDVLPVMRVYVKDSLDGLIKNEESFLKSVLRGAKEDGFHGISISGRCVKDDGFCKLLRKFKEIAAKEELKLHLELDGNDSIHPYKDLSETADVLLLNYEREKENFDKEFEDCERAVFKDYAAECEKEKTLADIFSPCYLGDEVTDFSEIERLMIARGIESTYCEKAKTASFVIKRYSGGRQSELSAVFPTPENIKAKLELLGELGYMGVSFDIQRSPVSSLMTFLSLFSAQKAVSGKSCCECES